MTYDGCPPLEVLGRYETGQMDAGDLARYGEHIESCETCLDFVGLVESWVPAPMEVTVAAPGVWDRLKALLGAPWEPVLSAVRQMGGEPSLALASLAPWQTGVGAVAGALTVGGALGALPRVIGAAKRGEVDPKSLALLLALVPASALFLLAALKMLKGDMDEAEAALEALPDEDPETWRLRAWAAHVHEHPKAMKAAMHRLDALAPESAHEIRGRLARGEQGATAFVGPSVIDFVAHAAKRDAVRMGVG